VFSEHRHPQTAGTERCQRKVRPDLDIARAFESWKSRRLPCAARDCDAPRFLWGNFQQAITHSNTKVGLLQEQSLFIPAFACRRHMSEPFQFISQLEPILGADRRDESFVRLRQAGRLRASMCSPLAVMVKNRCRWRPIRNRDETFFFQGRKLLVSVVLSMTSKSRASRRKPAVFAMPH